MTIFATRGQRMKVVIDGNFIAKKMKISKFEKYRYYIPQKKLRRCRIQIQEEIV